MRVRKNERKAHDKIREKHGERAVPDNKRDTRVRTRSWAMAPTGAPIKRKIADHITAYARPMTGRIPKIGLGAHHNAEGRSNDVSQLIHGSRTVSNCRIRNELRCTSQMTAPLTAVKVRVPTSDQYKNPRKTRPILIELGLSNKQQ